MKKICVFIIALLMVSGAKAQWFPIYADSMINMGNSHPAVFFLTTDIGYAVAGSRIWNTIDGGNNWLYQDSETGTGLNTVYFVNANIGYAGGCHMPPSGPPPRKHILKTTNGGLSWTIILSNPGELNSIYFLDANIGFVVGSDASWPPNPTILKTTDGGLSWGSSLINANTGWLFSVFFVDVNTGYAVGGYYGWPFVRLILKTNDGGSTWDAILNEQNFCLYSVYFQDVNTGYAVGDYGTILKTEDGGQNWVEQPSNTDYHLSSVIFTDTNIGYVVGGGEYNYVTDYVILKTINGGSTWINQSISGTAFPYSLSSVFFPAADTGYIAGYRLCNSDSTFGTFLYKTTNGGGLPVGTYDNIKPQSKLSIYPNPASTTLTIATVSKGTLSINNSNGQQSMQQEITQLSTTIDISGLKSGVYVVKVVGEKGVQVGKFIKR